MKESYKEELAIDLSLDPYAGGGARRVRVQPGSSGKMVLGEMMSRAQSIPEIILPDMILPVSIPHRPSGLEASEKAGAARTSPNLGLILLPCGLATLLASGTVRLTGG